MKTYITFNAGSNIWLVELFNEKIDWHNGEYRGTYKDCKEVSERKMLRCEPHYPNAEYGSIFDY